MKINIDMNQYPTALDYLGINYLEKLILRHVASEQIKGNAYDESNYSLASRFNCEIPTISRALRVLEEQGKIKRIFNGKYRVGVELTDKCIDFIHEFNEDNLLNYTIQMKEVKLYPKVNIKNLTDFNKIKQELLLKLSKVVIFNKETLPFFDQIKDINAEEPENGNVEVKYIK